MKVKQMIFPIIIVGLMIVPVLNTPVMAESVAPSEDRRLVKNVEMWSRYATPTATVFDMASPMETQYFTLAGKENDTLPATFASSGGSAVDTQVSDLNVTGGVGYSDDGFNYFTPEPNGYKATSSSALAKQIGLIAETEIPEFDSEVDRQYVTYEPSGTLREIQTDLAASEEGGRSNQYYAVNITDVYMKLDIDYDVMNELLTKVTTDDRWDVDNGMTDNEIISVLADYIFDYSHGMMLGVGNLTTVNTVSGQENWDLSNEVVATLSNATDANLNGFTTDTIHIYLGIISYIMEFGFTSETASMVASGIYGEVPSFRRGLFEGLAVKQTDAGTVYEQWLNLDSFGIFDAVNASDFAKDLKIVFSEFMDYKAIVEASKSYTGTIAFLFLVAYWLGVALLTDGGWVPIGNAVNYVKGKTGKGRGKSDKTMFSAGSGRRFAQMAVLALLTWYVIAFVVRLTVGA